MSHGLVDMVYPLKLRGKTIAVIFAGQKVTPDIVERIQRKIDEKDNIQEREHLEALIESEDECPRQTQDEVQEAFDQFQGFGQMLQNLLDKLYTQQWDNARREFLNDVVRKLTMAPADREGWTQALNDILKAFLDLTNMHEIQVYSRRHSRYEFWGKALADGQPPDDTDAQIPVRDVAPLPEETLISARNLSEHGPSEEDFEKLRRSLSLDSHNVTFFLHRHQEPHLALDTLIAFSGTVAPEDEEFTRNFCEAVAMRVMVAKLVFILQEQGESFAKRVGHVGHTAKAPLQEAISLLGKLGKALENRREMANYVNDCERNIMIAKAYMRSIYALPVTRGRKKDLRRLLEEVIDEIDDLTRERECIISLKPAELFVPGVTIQQFELSACTTTVKWR